MINRMRLYIWNEPYGGIPYGGEALYVVASSLEEAKEVAAKKGAFSCQWDQESRDREARLKEDDPERLTFIHRYFHDLGEPSFVRDLPCAEFYHHEE